MGTGEVDFFFFFRKRKKMPVRDRQYSIVGQDSRRDIKARNQGQLENLRKKYLSILGNSEVYKKGNRENTHWKPSIFSAKSELRV